MARTERSRHDGSTIRDGQHGKKCPSRGCLRCVTGDTKPHHRRRSRRAGKRTTQTEA